MLAANAASEARWVIDEGPWEPVLAGQVLGDRFHSEGLSCVVSGIKQIHAKFFGKRVAPMRALARDEAIHAGCSDFRHFATRPTGDHPHLLNDFGATRTKMHRPSDRLGESIGESLASSRPSTSDAHGDPLVIEKWLRVLKPDCVGEENVIAKNGVNIKREVR